MKIPFEIKQIENGVLNQQPIAQFVATEPSEMSICSAHGVNVLVVVYGGKPCPFCNPVEVTNG